MSSPFITNPNGWETRVQRPFVERARAASCNSPRSRARFPSVSSPLSPPHQSTSFPIPLPGHKLSLSFLDARCHHFSGHHPFNQWRPPLQLIGMSYGPCGQDGSFWVPWVRIILFTHLPFISFTSSPFNLSKTSPRSLVLIWRGEVVVRLPSLSLSFPQLPLTHHTCSFLLPLVCLLLFLCWRFFDSSSQLL